MGTPQRRFLVLGLDGGTFDLLDPLMAAGELPFLRSLVGRGFRAPLRSVYPAKTIPAWYSFATGKDPGELGIYGFSQPDGGPGRSALVRTFRPAEAVWDRLSRIGVKVGVLNFPMTPSYPLHGFIVPGMFADGAVTHPQAIREEIEGTLGTAYPGELPPYRETERASWVALATRAVEQRGHVAAALAARHRPGFLFALFRETDRVEHQHWAELNRPVGEIPDDLLGFWRTVDRACAQVDEAFRADGSPAVTLVISDHGHGAIRSDFLTNRWLANEGFLVFRDPAALARRRFVARLVRVSQRFAASRRLSRLVADFLRDARHEELANLVGGRASFEDVAPRIDWERTLAFSYPAPEGIYLNPNLPGLTPERRDEIVRAIRARLEAYPDAHIEVFGPNELYSGTPTPGAPALLIRIDRMETEPRMDFSYPEPLIRERPEFFYGSGTHRMDGILIGAGEGIAPGASPRPLRLLDVAPTILEGMGVEGPPDFSGRSFAGALGLSG